MLLEAIDAYESCDKLGFRRVQCSFSQSLVCLIGEVKVDEEKLHSGLPQHLERVLKGKRRLCLFRKLLLDSEHPDAKIADKMALGFPLCGWLPSSEVFPPKMRPPVLHVDALAGT